VRDGGLTARFERARPRLRAVAYRMLGSVDDAEDAVQEAWLRLSRDIGEVDNLDAWLTTVVARICLNMLRARRIRSTGELIARLPDPIVDAPEEFDPEHRALLADSVGLALFVVLDTLPPDERLAFVLHDVFGVPFDTIAETVGRPIGTCRQLARRARSKFHAAQPKLSDVAPAEHQVVTEKFIDACANGDIAALTAVLDPTVWGVGTILVDPAPPPQVNHGPVAVATNLLRYLGPEVTLVSGPVGQPVVLAFAQRRLFAVIVLTIGGCLVTKIEAVADPLARLGPLDQS
jgi:RNA polymerase sigma-70 factor (ECF subfamily)